MRIAYTIGVRHLVFDSLFPLTNIEILLFEANIKYYFFFLFLLVSMSDANIYIDANININTDELQCYAVSVRARTWKFYTLQLMVEMFAVTIEQR